MLNKPVRFNVGSGIYNAGEVAGFSQDEADGYIEKGIASPLTSSLDKPPADNMIKKPKAKARIKKGK